jgi:Fe-S oxidoreductase
MTRFSPVEIGLLLVLMAASVTLFAARFGRVASRIARAKAEPGYSIGPLAACARDFLWEVMLQGKVIRQRPLPGIAHAFVFWGFCVFALITLNHFATAFGADFLSREGAFGQFYFSFVAAFAVAVSVGILGLAYRRFLLRPRWLGEKLSYESGVIALLIFLLMITYLAAFVTPEDSAGWKPIWWAHTLVILVFLPLIPQTKHLHLILSPVSVFLKRPGFSRIPPLEGDEDFGLASGKDITNIVALQAYSCVECGRCTEHCPANLTGKILNPKEVALGMRAYLNEFGPGAEAPLLGKHLSQEAAFQCTTCGACEFQCPVGVQHLPIIVGLRRGAVNTGEWEDEHGTKLFLNLERTGNAMGFAASEREKFIEKQGFPIFDGSQQYCLWMGCMGSYDPQGKEILASFARVMDYLGTSWGVLRKERCTGDPARRLGNDLVFQTLAEANLETLRQSKVQRIVSICPHCVRTISTDWREYGEAPPVEHHSEFMDRFQDRLPANSAGEKIVFHDPCYLGRYRGSYDEPRMIISKYGQLIEPERTRERSFCCGAGGGLMFLGEEKGKRVNVERSEQLAASGAAVIGAACPFCNSMFQAALPSISASPPKLLDIAQLAAAAITASQAGSRSSAS